MLFAAVMNRYLWLLVLLCAAPTAGAQDNAGAQANLDSLGIAAFRETCLMPDPGLEKIYEWASARDLKMIEGRARREDRSKGFVWEIAASGETSLQLRVAAEYSLPRHFLACEVMFKEHSDTRKRVEIFFLDEMERRPDAKFDIRLVTAERIVYNWVDGDTRLGFFNGKLPYVPMPPTVLLTLFTHRAPPDVAPATPAFATAERSYKHFVDFCLAPYADIAAIEARMSATGWQRSGSGQNGEVYQRGWSLFDPFNVMGAYAVDVQQGPGYTGCGFNFDLRAAVPMDRLIRDYGLTPESSLDPAPTGTTSETRNYSATVGGRRLRFLLTTSPQTHSGQLTVYNDQR